MGHLLPPSCYPRPLTRGGFPLETCPVSVMDTRTVTAGSDLTSSYSDGLGSTGLPLVMMHRHVNCKQHRTFKKNISVFDSQLLLEITKYVQYVL